MSASLPPGKLPPDILKNLLGRFAATADPRVIVGPRYGEDAAVLEMLQCESRYLVCKADPITFASDSIGWYAVHVNANDIATMGATPKWFLPTILLPERGDAESLALEIMADIAAAADSVDVTIVGGHTEITLGLERTIVSGAMFGEVDREKLITSGGATPGDALVLTGGLGIEGTSILARELAHRVAVDLSEGEIERAKNFLHDPGISIVHHARVATDTGGIRAMHDPTEGGVATGVHELAEASQVGVVVEERQLVVDDITLRLCDSLDVDPLGLVASGSLLLAVAPESTRAVLAALHGVAITSAVIGRVTAMQDGVVIESDAGRRPLPLFDRDEAARVLADGPP